jgi:hypothetical protein
MALRISVLHGKGDVQKCFAAVLLRIAMRRCAMAGRGAEQRSKGNARKRMDLQRHGGARLRRAMEWQGKAWKSKGIE